MHFCTKSSRQFIEIAKAIVRMFCIVVCHARNLHYRIELCWGWKSAVLWWKKSSMLIPLNTLSYSFTVPFHRLVASQRSGYFCNMHMHEHRRLNFPLLDKQIKERVHRHKKKRNQIKSLAYFQLYIFRVDFLRWFWLLSRPDSLSCFLSIQWTDIYTFNRFLCLLLVACNRAQTTEW